MKNKKEGGFITRHSLKPGKGQESAEGFPGITEEGVELAAERARSLYEEIKNLPEGAVVLVGGVSKEVRTRSTMLSYINEIKELSGGDEGVDFVSSEEISVGTKEEGFSGTVKKITEMAESNPENKLIVDLPLMLKQLMDKGWFNQDGSPTEYTKKLLGSGLPLNEMEKQWFADKGILDGEQVGPNPEEVAKNLLKGMERLQNFAKKYLSERPVRVLMVGHSFELDALIMYLKGNGDVNVAEYDEVLGDIINETEVIKINVGDEDLSGEFRGQTYTLENK